MTARVQASMLSVRPEVVQFSADFGAVSLLNYTDNPGERGQKIHKRNFKTIPGMWDKNLQGLKSWVWLPKFCRTFGVLQNLSSTRFFLLCETFRRTFPQNPKGSAEFWGDSAKISFFLFMVGLPGLWFRKMSQVFFAYRWSPQDAVRKHEFSLICLRWALKSMELLESLESGLFRKDPFFQKTNPSICSMVFDFSDRFRGMS